MGCRISRDAEAIRVAQAQEANRAMMKYLPIVTYAGVHKIHPDECCYCLETLEAGEKVIVLPCMHMFHASCMDNWLPKEFWCPICRHNVAEGISVARTRVLIVKKLSAFLCKRFGGRRLAQ